MLAIREGGNASNEYRDLGLDQLDPAPPAVTLKELMPDEYEPLAKEYFIKKNIDDVFRSRGFTTQDWKDQIRARARLMKPAWSPGNLVEFYNDLIKVIRCDV